MNSTNHSWKNSLFLFDNLRFIAIFAIIFRHSTWEKIFAPENSESQQLIIFISNAISIFAIPIFAFCSGYGQKTNNTSFFSKLLTLYIGANAINIPYYLLYTKNNGEQIWPLHIIIGPAGTQSVYIWYFIALIIWRIITPFITQMRHPLFFTALAVIIIYPDLEIGAATLGSKVIEPWVRPIIYLVKFYPFYLLGVYTTRDKILTLRNSKNKYLLFPSIVISFYASGSNLIQYYDSNDRYHVNFIVYLIAATLSLASIIAFTPGKSFLGITKLGQNSMGIYIFHLLFIRMLILLFDHFGHTFNFTSHNAFIDVMIHATIAYAICFVTAQKSLMKALNYITAYIELLLFKKSNSLTHKP